MLEMWDGTVEAAKGLGSVVAHPIESAKSFGNGIAFVAKAMTGKNVRHFIAFGQVLVWKCLQILKMI